MFATSSLITLHFICLVPLMLWFHGLGLSEEGILHIIPILIIPLRQVFSNIKLKVSNLADVEGLLDGEAYKAVIG